MSDTDLIVPVQVHALLVNRKVRTLHPFHRYQPSFDRMLGTYPETEGRGAAEPEAFSGAKEVGGDETFEGVHVQWELPEALTDGFMAEEDGRTHFPLVPNRWLVVRYSWVRGERKAVGWVVHSDYLYSDDDGALWNGYDTINSFINPRKKVGPEVDWLGRVHRLADGPWQEPPGDRELFLTAAGAGLPSFAAFEPYHENVFSFHDDLQDLKDPAHGDSYPPDASLSYLVAGWYSDTDEDILNVAAGIPGLLPPDADSSSAADVIAALGWTVAGRTALVQGDMGTATGHEVTNLLDHQEDTYYLSEKAPVRSDRITVDLGSVQQVSSLHVLVGDPDGQHPLPAVRVQTSVDNVNWPSAHHQDFDAGTPVIEYHPERPVTARYVQLWMLESGPGPVAVRRLEATAAPQATRSLYHGTALGLEWKREGEAPDDTRPDATHTKIVFGHSTGEAATMLIGHQTRSPRTAQLFSALYHGTLDTFDGADGDRDLAEVTHRSWFSGSDGGHTWQIVPRDDQEPASGRSGTVDDDPFPLDELNAAQAEYDHILRQLTELQWRVWTLHWLWHLPAVERPDDLPADFDTTCEELLAPDGDGPANQAKEAKARLCELRDHIPQAAAGQDLQDAIDAWATAKGLADRLQLKRLPQDNFYKPADPVVLIEGTGGGTVPLTRDHDNPLPCRVPANPLAEVKIGANWTAPPASPPDPGIIGLPDACTDLLKEFALLDEAAHTPDNGHTALHTITQNPATHARGPLAEYCAPWRQPWLPMLLMWKLNYFPTPYHTADGYHWTFTAPPPGSELDTYSYLWNGTGTLKADFESEGDVLNRLFRSRAYLAPTTVYVLREQLARYRAGYPSVNTAGLAALRRELEPLDVLSQTLDGFNDWLLQLDGGAQVPTEPEIAALAGEQNHVPDPAGGPHQKRFQPVRAGQFFLTDLRIVDRFGRCADLVTSGASGNWYDQYPLKTPSVTPSHDLYTEPRLINPERFVQLPPRILQDTRLAIAQAPSGQADGLAGLLLVNYLDRTLGVYGTTGQALGELRTVTTSDDTQVTVYAPLPHSPYTGHTDPRFTTDHPQLAAFLAGLLDRDDSAGAFGALLATIDKSLRAIVAPAAEDSRLPGLLIGRPVALVHATLDLELHHPLPADPSWDTVLTPLGDSADDDTWAIRLGDAHALDDGLIGYFSADPGQPVDYGLLRALDPAIDHDYLQATTNGSDLALPVRPATRPCTRHVTLLAHPHLPVHATTDILPVHSLRLDPERVHQALAAVRASFRLNPLLATTRNRRGLGTTMTEDPDHPLSNISDSGQPDAEFRSLDVPAVGSTLTLDLGAVQQLTGYALRTGTTGGGSWPGTPVLESSVTGDDDGWEPRAFNARQPVNEHTLATPLPARYLRLRLTTDADATFGMRTFRVTCTPDDAALVVPPLSARHGTWSWAQPQATGTEQLDWDERLLIPADHLAHPDDAMPTARAGYLQLHPATRQADPEPTSQP
ncbi:discoidin domain-containing protein [Streptomyces platensis]|uniref:discoidin domain-containing protein n=1 Tax=Streptomyces platensis TaxID=58346 RepID=UPI0033287CAD